MLQVVIDMEHRLAPSYGRRLFHFIQTPKQVRPVEIPYLLDDSATCEILHKEILLIYTNGRHQDLHTMQSKHEYREFSKIQNTKKGWNNQIWNMVSRCVAT